MCSHLGPRAVDAIETMLLPLGRGWDGQSCSGAARRGACPSALVLYASHTKKLQVFGEAWGSVRCASLSELTGSNGAVQEAMVWEKA